MDVHRCTSDPFAGGVAALYDATRYFRAKLWRD